MDEISSPKKKILRISREDQSNTKEGRVFVGAPDFRVFVWGIEITSDVFSVSVSQTVDEEIATATVNIINDNSKWVLPPGIGVIPFDLYPDELSDRPLTTANTSQSLFGPDTTSRRPGSYVTPIQFAKKKQENFKRFLSSLGEIGQRVLDQFSRNIHFPFLPGGPLFQAGDRIRIFLNNPWTFQGQSTNVPTDSEEWYFAFTGFIGAVTEEFDGTSNQSVIHLYCEEIRRVLRYMRTTTNPLIFHLDQVTLSDLKGEERPTSITGRGAEEVTPPLRTFAPDTILYTGNNAPQSGQVIVDRSSPDSSNGFLEWMLIGVQNQEAANLPGQRVTVDGVMGFPYGKKEIIELVLDETYEQRLSPVMDRIYPKLSYNDVTRYGADWSLGSDPRVFTELGTDPNKLWVILPVKEHFPDRTYPFDWENRVDIFSEWESRFNLISDFVKKLDCTWYSTPKGDIVFEFTNYDSVPLRYESPWSSIFTIYNEWRRYSYTEDDRNIKTFTLVNASPVDQYDLSRGAPFLSYGRHINPELIARFGVREQRSNRPFYYKEDVAGQALNALASRLQELANADAFRIEGMECLPNFRAVAARPYFIAHRNIIAFAKSIRHRVVWGQMAQTVYTFQYVRHFDIVTREWKKISGNFGHSWMNTELPSEVRKNNQPGNQQTQPVRYEAPPFERRDDVTQEILTNSVSEYFRIRPNLSTEDKQKLDSIISQFSAAQTTEDRKKLIDEFTTVLNRAK